MSSDGMQNTQPEITMATKSVTFHTTNIVVHMASMSLQLYGVPIEVYGVGFTGPAAKCSLKSKMHLIGNELKNIASRVDEKKPRN